MKIFDIKVHTSDREYDITLRNLSIIRVSQIIHRIRVSGSTLISSIKRFLVPGKLTIKPLIKIRTIKAHRQNTDVALDGQTLVSSLKRTQVDDTVRISADGNISSTKRMRAAATWRVITDVLLEAKKDMPGSNALLVAADMYIQKVRKRKLGEVSLVRLTDMEPMTLDELDYVVEEA